MAEVTVSKRKVLGFLVLALILVGGIAVGFYFLGHYTVLGQDCRTQAGANSSITEPTPAPQKQDGRLPRNIVPKVYKVELFPDIYGEDSSLFTFTGFVSLLFECVESTSAIIMNINSINITSIEVRGAGFSTSFGITSYSIDTKWQFLTINLDQTLINGREYVVAMNYTGPLKTDFAGLYLSAFQRRTKNRYVAATQFSPTDARKAFPCLDEPDRKAQFDITLVRREDFVSLSNMPIISQIHRSDRYVADIYRRTPKMSPYLVAMVVGNLVPKTIPARQGLNFTAWAAHESVENTETALTVGVKALMFFEEYFGIDFPLPKQDILALPETAVGAMENWGLIIFNDKMIFYNETEYSLLSLKQSVVTIVHEVAHQWFGNLVTMNWWSDLMLKEGFAMYFASVGTAHVYPKWNIEDEYAVSYMHVVFQVDGLVTSHPVYKQLFDTTQIRQVFDGISYRKGGCLIRMLNFILGDSVFQNGLKHYLNKHQYDSVSHDDLWTALEEGRRKPEVISNMTSNGKDTHTLSNKNGPGVKEVMDTWVLQMNYPVVTITQVRPGILFLIQERFLNDGVRPRTEDSDSPFNYKWQIPLTYTSSTSVQFNHTSNDILWMRGQELYIIDRNLPDFRQSGNWLIANIKQYGYYRVNYDLDIWTNLITQLRSYHGVIHAVNRAQIINDLFSLGKANVVNVSLALSALEYLEQERDFVPWVAAYKEIMVLDKLLKYSDIYKAFSQGIVNMTRSLFEELREDYETLPITQKFTFVKLFTLACHFEMSNCIEESSQSYNNWANGIQKHVVNPDLRASILCSAVSNGNASVWEFVLHMYNTTLNTNEKAAYLNGLACTRDGTLQNRLITLSMETSTIQGREAVKVLIALASNRLALDKVWKHVTEHWGRFMEVYAGSLFLLNELVSGITGSFVTREQLHQLETFVNSTSDLGPAEQAFSQARERINSNIKWLDEHYRTVEEWVHYKSSAK